MRAVFIGASSLTTMTARLLLRRRHEVVIVERDKSRIEALSTELDCGYLNGDGSKPAVLRETGPSEDDTLYCLTGDDKTNILAALVGKSLGFGRVVTKIVDPELEHICIELGLENTIIPARTIGRYLADMLEGRDPLELSTMIREEARIFTFVAREEDQAGITELDLPELSRLICIYRNDRFVWPDKDARIQAGDEVVIITHQDNLAELAERWGAHAGAS